MKRGGLLAAGLGALLAYELLAHVNEDDPTISEIVWRANQVGPLLPFVAGVLAGHLFAQAKR